MQRFYCNRILFVVILLISASSFRLCGYRNHPSFNRQFTTLRQPSAIHGFPLDSLTFLENIVQQSQPTIQGEQLLTSVSEASTVEGLNPLGNDLLIFLCATIGIVPLFKWLNASPVLGFLAAGLLMGPAGLHLFSDLHDMESLADFGVLFLLFEQGLELTVARLKSVSKYAFGMGTLQVVLSTVAFFVFPFIGGVQFLEVFFRSDPSVVDITRPDEALVVGAALSLSSSAFVLKILQEKSQMSSKFGEAALGILLLQDIAVVPLLVLLPIIESGAEMSMADQMSVLGLTFVKALLGLGGILVIGGRFIRYLFSIIAKTQSSETFVALCLLVAVGVGALTDSLGLSSTLGAFVAGTLLAESNYRTQIETDIKPFKGLLLGLFFLTTGASVDPFVIKEQLPTVLALLGGLIAFKATIVATLGPFFNLSKADSVRTGLILSGGGEFAFVVLTLADKLHVIPDQLAKILVGVVVLSMALTPTLSSLGDQLATLVQDYERRELFHRSSSSSSSSSDGKTFSSVSMGDKGIEGREEVTVRTQFSPSNDRRSGDENVRATKGQFMSETIVICGFGNAGETIAQAIDQLAQYQGDDQRHYDYVAFDLDPSIVMNAYRAGNRKLLYGDGSQPLILETAGINNPKAFVVTHEDLEMALKAVERIHECFPATPVYALASNQHNKLELRMAGATSVITLAQEGGLLLSKKLLTKVGGFEADYVLGLLQTIREDIRKSEADEYDTLLRERYASDSSSKLKSERDSSNNRRSGSNPQQELATFLRRNVLDAQRNLLNIVDSVVHLGDREAVKLQEAADEEKSKEYEDILNSVSAIQRSTSPLIDEELGGPTVCPLPAPNNNSEGSVK